MEQRVQKLETVLGGDPTQLVIKDMLALFFIDFQDFLVILCKRNSYFILTREI